MTFRSDLWTRFEFKGTPVYVRGDKPDWFVPNEAGDKVLQELARRRANGFDIQAQRFLARLPDDPVRLYGGRSELMKTEHLPELWFHITNRCNQACRHCLFASSPDEKTELATTRIREIAAQATTLGCRVFALTGGEPLVHPDFESIVDSLLGQEAAHVVVLTNGTLLRDYSRALARWPADRFHLQISVDGLGHNHDRIRGGGAFDALAAQLAWLKEQKIAFTLSMCVTSENLKDMLGLVDFSAEMGAVNLHFIWYFVRGRGAPKRFAPPEDIFPRLVEAAERAAKAGVRIDNLEALRSQVFAPSGTVHDGAGSGWESLAVGPDGKIYPSPALVGVKALATPINSDLGEAWRRSPVLEALRSVTAAHLSSPWRFLLGGGDPDHSYLHAGEFMGHDPYWPLYEQTAMWLIAREAARQPVNGPPRLRLKMGDILESCGAHGAVALTHTNCLLAAATPDTRTVVKKFYQAASETTQEDILNPVCYPDEAISHIPAEYRFRGYGCGSPVLDAQLQPGEKVLDLGCGTGVECFIAARLVGEKGRATGVDMLDAMLAHAEQGATGVAANLRYRNLEFKKGYLEELPVPDKSMDVVLSNCVINLSGHKRRTFAEIFRVLKPGGRLVIADVVCETEPEAAIKNDATLRGECIAGALTQRDLFGLLEESGFVAPRVVKRFPYRVVRGHPFFSLTFEARKPIITETRRVMYRGPFTALVTSRGDILPVGVTREIPLDELPTDSEDFFIFDAAGAVTNLAMEAPACCPSKASSCCNPSGTATPTLALPEGLEPILEFSQESQEKDLLLVKSRRPKDDSGKAAVGTTLRILLTTLVGRL